MEYTKGELCSCGFTQSFPIPHEHDRTEREKIIIGHYENKLEAYSKMYEALGELQPYISYTGHPGLLKIIEEAISLAKGK